MKKLISIFMISCCFYVWCEPNLTYDSKTHSFSLSDAEKVSKELKDLVNAHGGFSFTIYEWVETMENYYDNLIKIVIGTVSGKDTNAIRNDPGMKLVVEKELEDTAANLGAQLAGKLYQFGIAAEKFDEVYDSALAKALSKNSTFEINAVKTIRQQAEKDMAVFEEATKKLSILFGR